MMRFTTSTLQGLCEFSFIIIKRQSSANISKWVAVLTAHLGVYLIFNQCVILDIDLQSTNNTIAILGRSDDNVLLVLARDLEVVPHCIKSQWSPVLHWLGDSDIFFPSATRSHFWFHLKRSKVSVERIVITSSWSSNQTTCRFGMIQYWWCIIACACKPACQCTQCIY